MLKFNDSFAWELIDRQNLPGNTEGISTISKIKDSDDTSSNSPPTVTCERCGRLLQDGGYLSESGQQHEHRCLRCMVIHPTLVKRCLAISLVVGTLLTLINHAGTFIDGEFTAALGWKIPLNYAVPYTVATVSALLNARGAMPETSRTQ